MGRMLPIKLPGGNMERDTKMVGGMQLRDDAR